MSAQWLWYVANHQVPVSRSNLLVYGDLLHALGRALLGARHGVILKKKLDVSDAGLLAANQELQNANVNLQSKVAELGKSNEEKIVLLQEVHHRVNNNLQVIASLLRLQSKASGDAKLAEALHTTERRIEAMAMIHAQLYDAVDLLHVDFADYTARLAGNLLDSYGVDRQRIILTVKMDALTLPIDQAIPTGLIFGELITNAIKYAFPEQRRGSILIEGKEREGRIELIVRDDGVGIVHHPEMGRNSKGLHIVKILCGQLHATLEQTQSAEPPEEGTAFHISFPRKVSSPEAVPAKSHAAG